MSCSMPSCNSSALAAVDPCPMLTVKQVLPDPASARLRSAGLGHLPRPIFVLQASTTELQSAFISDTVERTVNLTSRTWGPPEAFGTFCGGTFGTQPLLGLQEISGLAGIRSPSAMWATFLCGRAYQWYRPFDRICARPTQGWGFRTR